MQSLTKRSLFFVTEPPGEAATSKNRAPQKSARETLVKKSVRKDGHKNSVPNGFFLLEDAFSAHAAQKITTDAEDFDFLLEKYKDHPLLQIESNAQGLWKLIFALPQKVIVGVDVNVHKNHFLQARILAPKFLFEGETHILWNGVLTAPGFTLATYKKHDFVASLLSLLQEERQIVSSKYEDLALTSAFARLAWPSPSLFTALTLPWRPLKENIGRKDEIFLSAHLLAFLHARVQESALWVLGEEEYYFELETELGCKCVAKLSAFAHNKEEDVLLLPEFLVQNLLLANKGEGHLRLRLISVPVAKSILLWVADPVFRELPTTTNKLKAELENYVTFTAGTLLTFFDSEFGQEQSIAVLEVKSWERALVDTHLAVTTLVPSATRAEMFVFYDETPSSPPYSKVDPLAIYEQIKQ